MNTNINEPKWYIVSCYSGHEDSVAEMIKQSVDANNLQEKVPSILVPVQEKVQIKNGKKKTLKEKVFPGYVLVQMTMDDITWNLIRNTEGVTKFLGTGKRPNPLSDSQVENILAYTQVKQPTFETSYAINDVVRLTDGPFKDFIGKISEINADKGQAKVLLNVFGRETPVQVDILILTKI